MHARSPRAVPVFGQWEKYPNAQFTTEFDVARINRRSVASFEGEDFEDDLPVLIDSPRSATTAKRAESGARIPPGDRLSLFPPEKVSQSSKTKTPQSSRPEGNATAGRNVIYKPHTAVERLKYEVDGERKKSPALSAPPGEYHRPRNAPSVVSGSSSGGSEPWFDVHEPPVRIPGTGKGMTAPELKPTVPKFGGNRSPPEGGYTKQFESLRDVRHKTRGEAASTLPSPRSPMEASERSRASAQPVAYETAKCEPSVLGNQRKMSRDDRPVIGVGNEMGAMNIGLKDVGRNAQLPSPTSSSPRPIPSFGNWEKDSTTVSRDFEEHRLVGRKVAAGSPKPPMTQSAPRQWSDGSVVDGHVVQGQNFKKVAPEIKKYTAVAKGPQEIRKVVEVKSATITKKPESVSCFSCLSPKVQE